MAAGALTVAALRSRPRQSALVVALTAVVVAAAALGPLYARAVEQSVLRAGLTAAVTTRTSLVVTDASVHPVSPSDLADRVRPAIPALYDRPVGGAEAPVVLAVTGTPARTRLTARDDACRQVRVVQGRCPTAAGEVLMSRRASAGTGLAVGREVLASSGQPGRGGVRQQLVVVGVYDGLDPSSAYWSGREAPLVVAADSGGRDRVVDDLLTGWDTLAAVGWPDLKAHLDVPLRTGQVDLQDVPELRGTPAAVDVAARGGGGYATSGIGAVLDEVTDQVRPTRTIVPLLAVQLAVLGIVVLGFVCAAVTEQRRPEVALARLRGLGARGAAGLLLRELGALIMLGAAAGAALGWLVCRVAAAAWLQPGVVPELRRPVELAVALALLAALLASAAAAGPVLRQPLTALLRRVPPRASGLRVGLIEGAVVAAAVAGVVTLLTSNGGPVALLAPGLLAVAGGLLLAQLAVPISALLARRALRRGRTASALAALQIARRPALRRSVAIITAACALLVFAVDAWAVASRGRTTRADVEAGAAVVFSVDAPGPRELRSALLAIDPDGRYATPVVSTRSASAVGATALAVEPAAFRRIARWGRPADQPSGDQLAALHPATVPALPLPAGTTRLEVTATAQIRPLPRPPNFQGDLQPIALAIALTPAHGDVLYRALPALRPGRATYATDVRCGSCELSGLVIERTFGDTYPADVDVSIDAVRAGPVSRLVPLDLGPAVPVAWQVVPNSGIPNEAQVSPGPPLRVLQLTSFESVELRRGDVPAVTPALIAGDVPPHPTYGPPGGPELVQGPDLSGNDHVFQVQGRLPLVPRAGSSGLITELASLAAAGTSTSTVTSYDVWLAAEDPGRERALRQSLAQHGLQVVSRDSAREHAAAYAAQGPALALRLALLDGVVALLLAAAVLVVGVATSGAARARDLAGLRIVGVPYATVRGAAVREHLAVAVLGAVAGSALGLLAAQATLPDVPVFADAASAHPASLMPSDLGPAWSAVIATTIGCLVLLSLVCVLVGRALAGSAVPQRLQSTP